MWDNGVSGASVGWTGDASVGWTGDTGWQAQSKTLYWGPVFQTGIGRVVLCISGQGDTPGGGTLPIISPKPCSTNPFQIKAEYLTL